MLNNPIASDFFSSFFFPPQLFRSTWTATQIHTEGAAEPNNNILYMRDNLALGLYNFNILSQVRVDVLFIQVKKN